MEQDRRNTRVHRVNGAGGFSAARWQQASEANDGAGKMQQMQEKINLSAPPTRRLHGDQSSPDRHVVDSARAVVEMALRLALQNIGGASIAINRGSSGESETGTHSARMGEQRNGNT